MWLGIEGFVEVKTRIEALDQPHMIDLAIQEACRPETAKTSELNAFASVRDEVEPGVFDEHHYFDLTLHGVS